MRETVSFELAKEIEKDVLRLVPTRNQTSDPRIPRSDAQPRSLCGSMVEHWSAESESLSSISHEDSEFFLCPTLVTRRKKSFSNLKQFTILH